MKWGERVSWYGMIWGANDGIVGVWYQVHLLALNISCSS